MSLPHFPKRRDYNRVGQSYDWVQYAFAMEKWKLEHEKRLHEFCELVEPAIYKDYDSESIKKYEEKKKSLLEPNK